MSFSIPTSAPAAPTASCRSSTRSAGRRCQLGWHRANEHGDGLARSSGTVDTDAAPEPIAHMGTSRGCPIRGSSRTSLSCAPDIPSVLSITNGTSTSSTITSGSSACENSVCPHGVLCRRVSLHPKAEAAVAKRRTSTSAFASSSPRDSGGYLRPIFHALYVMLAALNVLRREATTPWSTTHEERISQ